MYHSSMAMLQDLVSASRPWNVHCWPRSPIAHCRLHLVWNVQCVCETAARPSHSMRFGRLPSFQQCLLPMRLFQESWNDCCFCGRRLCFSVGKRSAALRKEFLGSKNLRCEALNHKLKMQENKPAAKPMGAAKEIHPMLQSYSCIMCFFDKNDTIYLRTVPMSL